MADKLYVSLAQAVVDIQARLNLDVEAAQKKIINAHELGDLDLRLRRPDDPPDGPFNEKLSRSVWRDLDPWDPNESRRLLFEKSEIDAEQIARRVGWRSRRRAVPTERCRIYVARESLDQLEPPEGPEPTKQAEPLKPAPESEIRKAIDAVYNDAEAAGEKPPNLKQLPKKVRPLLKGYQVSDRRIMDVGRNYGDRRRKPGATIRNEQSRPK
jgi:hypothetical protein